jgi:hypothetical protein
MSMWPEMPKKVPALPALSSLEIDTLRVRALARQIQDAAHLEEIVAAIDDPHTRHEVKQLLLQYVRFA